MDEQFGLNDKYTRTEGTVLLSGIQALVRLPIDQSRLDRAAGRRTGTFISGYPGSPLGVFDMALASAKSHLEQHDIVHQPGTNEELSAVAVWGSQQTPRPYSQGRTGVVGIWYGKAPGVDRSGDSFRHGNFMGVNPNGGVLALAGDDPSAKSSTLPTDSQSALYDLAFPIIVPSSISDILDLGLHAIQLSRFSGNWVGMKLVTNLCDGLGTFDVRAEREFLLPPVEVNGRPWHHRQLRSVLTPISLEQETELFGGRLVATKAYLEANDINPTVRRTPHDQLGIVSYGKPFTDLIEAMDLLGLDPDRTGLPPIRVLKLGASYPLPERTIREFAAGLSEILVVEEKRSFVETQIKEILYPVTNRPEVFGKSGRDARPLVPATGELNQARIMAVLESWLGAYLPDTQTPERQAIRIPLSVTSLGDLPKRTAVFCSGCPHSRSTVIPAGALSGGGCGCHSMIYIEGRHRDDDLFSVVPMGTEGAEWIGLSPFVDTPHMFQNIGDGTYFHSGVNAVRACVDAGVNMTFKLLFNSAIAMTGGQPVPGAHGVEALTRELEAMGVNRTIVCTDNVRKYRRQRIASNAVVRPRENVDSAQGELAGVTGVTVLLYDQYCAATARRLRKRGVMQTPAAQVVINEAVCEGCGDCQTKSNCVSVVSVQTDLGRKTQIQDSSCNRDYSCLSGDCPSFVTVVPKEPGKKRSRASLPDEPQVLEPESKAIVPVDSNQAYGLILAGIGGTGVMTTNQILAVAAAMDGYSCVGLDQTGLAQKGGPVLSHLRISRAKQPRLSGAIARGGADAFLAFDPIVGVSEVAMACLNAERTSSIIGSDVAPTRDMIVEDAMRDGVNVGELIGTIAAACLPERTYTVPALSLSESLFDDHMPSNLLLLGAAYQRGMVPLSRDSIRSAITLNGVDVKKNLVAFESGRSTVLVERVAPEVSRLGSMSVTPSERALRHAASLTDRMDLPGALADTVAKLTAELYDFGGPAPARRYVELVGRAAEATRKSDVDVNFTDAVARNFFKVLAYKDEYEVARLLLKDPFLDDIARQVGPSTTYFHLHPPILKTFGLKRKIRIRSTWAIPMFKVLRTMRPLRGTPFDPFGHVAMRQRERKLIDDYERCVRQAAEMLATFPEKAVAVASLPEKIRGYEELKNHGIDLFNETARSLLNLSDSGDPKRVSSTP